MNLASKVSQLPRLAGVIRWIEHSPYVRVSRAMMANGHPISVVVSPSDGAWRGDIGLALVPADSRRREMMQRAVEQHATEALRSNAGREATRYAP